MNVWVCGTSVSLIAGGYLDQLRERLPADAKVRNLSIGDQDSVMGCVRLLQYQDDLKAGDVLIWEYSLLDILLNGFFGLDDAITAMRSAWRLALQASVRPIVIMITPRDHVAAPTVVEKAIRTVVDEAGLPSISFRDLLAEVSAADTSAHYSDDRHPANDSPAVAGLVERILKLLREHPDMLSAGDVELRDPWVWWGARDLARAGCGELVNWKNSLLSVEALRLSPDNLKLALPSEGIIRIGVISTNEAGSLWCGHAMCNPASLKKPANLPLTFMLRLTRLPCARGAYRTIEAAPPHAFANGAWADYGQVKAVDSRPADVFGVLAARGTIS